MKRAGTKKQNIVMRSLKTPTDSQLCIDAQKHQKFMQTYKKQQSRTEILSDMQVLSSLKQGGLILPRRQSSNASQGLDVPPHYNKPFDVNSSMASALDSP